MKSGIVMMLIIVMAAICFEFGYVIYHSNLSPLDVAQSDLDLGDSVLSFERILYESPVSDDKYIIIYLNPRGNVCNVLLEKEMFGYQVVDFNGELSTENTAIPVGLHFGWYRHEEGWVGSGVIYSEKVDKIIIDGEEASIVEVDDLRFWYLHGERELDNENVQVLNTDGEELSANTSVDDESISIDQQRELENQDDEKFEMLDDNGSSFFYKLGI